MKTIRFGIIGLGSIAKKFAKVLSTADHVTLTAVAARDESRAIAFAEQFGAEKHYSSYVELAKDIDVDAVYIALTHNFHYEVIKMCLLHGKNVLCEKPMVLHADEAIELAELAEAKGLTLMEAMWTRCLPAYRKTCEWVMEGRIGNVGLIQASFCFNVPVTNESRLFNPELAGGALYDVGVYVVEFATGILDESPVEIAAVSQKCETGVDSFTSLSLRFDSGAVASLTCGITGSSSLDGHVIGDNGRILVHKFYMSEKCELFDKDNQLIETFEEKTEDGFIYQIEHFADLVRHGELESPYIPLRDTIACAELFDEVQMLCDLP